MIPHVAPTERLEILRTAIQGMFTKNGRFALLMSEMGEWLYDNDYNIDPQDLNKANKLLEESVFRSTPMSQELECTNRISIRIQFIAACDGDNERLRIWCPKLVFTVRHTDGQPFGTLSDVKGYTLTILSGGIDETFDAQHLHIDVDTLDQASSSHNSLEDLSDEEYLDTLTALHFVAESY